MAETIMDKRMVTTDPADVDLSIKEKLMYSCGGFADNMVMGLGTYMSFFLTDIVVIPATFVASMQFFCKFWDAIIDPPIGAMADRTNTRFGRYRAWMMNFPALLVAVPLFFFALPTESLGLKQAWAVFTYLLYFTAYSIYDIPYTAAAAVLTKNYKSRGSISSYRLAFGNIGNLICQSGFLVLMPFLGGATRAQGYFRTVVFCMVCTIPFFIIAVIGTKERVQPDVTDKPIPIKEFYRVLRGNKPLLWICLAHICWGLFGSLLGTRIYYFTYVIGETTLFSTHAAFWLAGMSCGPVVNSWAMKLCKNKRTPGMVCWLTGGAVLICTYFLNFTAENIMIYHIIGFIYGLCGFCGLNAIFACWPDLTEYTKYKYGLTTTGFLFAFVNFVFQFGGSFSSAAFQMIIGVLGYTPNVPQPPEILFVMKASITLVQGCILLIGAFCLWQYRIDENAYKEFITASAEG